MKLELWLVYVSYVQAQIHAEKIAMLQKALEERIVENNKVIIFESNLLLHFFTLDFGNSYWKV